MNSLKMFVLYNIAETILVTNENNFSNSFINVITCPNSLKLNYFNIHQTVRL